MKLEKTRHLFLICLGIFSVSAIFFSAILASAYSILLGWDSNSEPDLEGYIVYSSVESPYPPYDEIDTYPESKLDDPLNPIVKITDLEKDVRYYFVVTAYNTSGHESDYSKVLSVFNARGADATFSSGKKNSGGGGGGG